MGEIALVKTWALVTNGVRARILRDLESGASAGSIELVTKSDSTHLRDILTDKSGRSFASDGSGRRSVMEPGSDPILRDMQDFANDTWDRLSRHWKAGDFRRLAIFASPKMLGILRQYRPAFLTDAIMFERASNLVGMPEHDLRLEVLRQIKAKPEEANR